MPAMTIPSQSATATPFYPSTPFSPLYPLFRRYDLNPPNDIPASISMVGITSDPLAALTNDTYKPRLSPPSTTNTGSPWNAINRDGPYEWLCLTFLGENTETNPNNTTFSANITFWYPVVYFVDRDKPPATATNKPTSSGKLIDSFIPFGPFTYDLTVGARPATLAGSPTFIGANMNFVDTITANGQTPSEAGDQLIIDKPNEIGRLMLRWRGASYATVALYQSGITPTESAQVLFSVL